MKKKISILFIALATIMTMLLVIVPHHHHKEATCMIMERCEKDNSINDKHTAHHADKGLQHNQSCVAESDFYVQKTDSRIKCKLSCNDCDNNIHLFPIIYLFTDFLTSFSETANPKPEYREYISFYTSEDASQFHGLRAPPFFS